MLGVKTSFPSVSWLNAFRYPFIVIWGTVIFGSATLTTWRERKVHQRGTRLTTPLEFQQKVRGKGVAIPTIERSGFLKRSKTRFLNIKADDENKHFLICGDTGTGKSALFHYLVRQISLRPHDQLAIYDPKGEYWDRHGIKERGDIWFYPSSPDCPYWDLFADIKTKEDAILFAKSLIPCKEGDEGEFFIKTPRDILTILLQKAHKHSATIADFLSWLSDPNEIESVVKGLPEAMQIPKDAATQRAGVLGTLSTIANTFRLLPQTPIGRTVFSCGKWVKKREGWLFIGCRGVRDQEVFQPIHSIFFDILIQSLLVENKHPPPTWLLIDELAALKTLPFLEKAVAQTRSYNVRCVLGFQNLYQVQHYYGLLSHSILSSPKTKIFLRTSEVDSAEWCAKMIGQPENEQKVRTESAQYTNENRGSLSYRVDRRVDYLVLPNELQILADREGYLSYEGLTTKIKFDYPNFKKWNAPEPNQDLDQIPEPAAARAYTLPPSVRPKKVRS